MTHRHKQMLALFLVAEVFIFSYFYVWGAQGLTFLWKARHENKQQEEVLEKLQQQLVRKEAEVAQWKAHDFYREKVAREQLQMARKGEVVYYLP